MDRGSIRRPMRVEQVNKIIKEVRKESQSMTVGNNLREVVTQFFENVTNQAIDKFLYQFQILMRLEMARINRIISKEYDPETDKLTEETIKLIQESPYSPKIKKEN